MTEEVQPQGLSAAEVAERTARGEVNVDAGVRTRSVRQIVRENTRSRCSTPSTSFWLCSC